MASLNASVAKIEICHVTVPSLSIFVWFALTSFLFFFSLSNRIRSGSQDGGVPLPTQRTLRPLAVRVKAVSDKATQSTQQSLCD